MHGVLRTIAIASIYPLPEDSIGFDSEQIADIVRCQTLDAIRAEIIDNTIALRDEVVYERKTAVQYAESNSGNPARISQAEVGEGVARVLGRSRRKVYPGSSERCQPAARSRGRTGGFINMLIEERPHLAEPLTILRDYCNVAHLEKGTERNASIRRPIASGDGDERERKIAARIFV
jgi:hypothetical protein